MAGEEGHKASNVTSRGPPSRGWWNFHRDRGVLSDKQAYIPYRPSRTTSAQGDDGGRTSRTAKEFTSLPGAPFSHSQGQMQVAEFSAREVANQLHVVQREELGRTCTGGYNLIREGFRQTPALVMSDAGIDPLRSVIQMKMC